MTELRDQGPWLLILLAIGVVLGTSSQLEKIGKLRAFESKLLLSNIHPDGGTPPLPLISSATFVFVTASVLLVLILGSAYLLAEAKRRSVVAETGTKAYRTMQGMMAAATLVRSQTYPAATVVDKSFDRLHLCYEIAVDFTTTVRRQYTIRAGTQALHFWEMSFGADGAADPVGYLLDLNFRIRDVGGKESVAYLPTDNTPYRKAVSIYFLPRVLPGQSRTIEITYCWPGMCRSLEKTGTDSFRSTHDSYDPVKEVVIEVFLAPGTGGAMDGRFAGKVYPGAKITKLSQASTGWAGFRYEVANAPSGPGVEHLVHAEWAKP